jgi:hypothetical protein
VKHRRGFVPADQERWLLGPIRRFAFAASIEDTFRRASAADGDIDIGEVAMGMRIGGSGSGQSPGIANWQQRQQTFKDFFSSLKSADLGSAKSAYASVVTASGTISRNGALAKVGEAPQGGDVAGAAKAAEALQAGRGLAFQLAASASPAASVPALSSTGAGSLINLTA